MPDTNPVIYNTVIVEYILSKANKVSLYNSGVRLFSDDSKSVHDADLMRKN